MAAAIEVWHNVKKTAAFALVIDTSGSMTTLDGYTSSRMTFAKEAIVNFINSTDDQDYLMAYSFTSEYSNPGFVRDVADGLISWVSSLNANGGTPLYGTIEEAYNDLYELKQTNEAMNISWNYGLVAMTDGVPSSDTASFSDVCDAFATEAGIDTSICDGDDIDEYALSPDIIHFFPIVFGSDANAVTDELELIADISSGAYFESDNDELEDVYFLISLEL